MSHFIYKFLKKISPNEEKHAEKEKSVVEEKLIEIKNMFKKDVDYIYYLL